MIKKNRLVLIWNCQIKKGRLHKAESEIQDPYSCLAMNDNLAAFLFISPLAAGNFFGNPFIPIIDSIWLSGIIISFEMTTVSCWLSGVSCWLSGDLETMEQLIHKNVIIIPKHKHNVSFIFFSLGSGLFIYLDIKINTFLIFIVFYIFFHCFAEAILYYLYSICWGRWLF